MKNDALFCIGQKAFIEKDDKVLVLGDPEEGLDFPGGKIQEGEAVDGGCGEGRKDLPTLLEDHRPRHHRRA